MEKIKIRQATKQGYIEMVNGGVADLSYPKSQIRRGRCQGDPPWDHLTNSNNYRRII